MPVSPGTTSRELIEGRVARRAAHETDDDFRDTCSFARAERLLGREYHGRFLIELLQNAADAWLLGDTPDEFADVTVVLDHDDPALVVANRGLAFPAGVVIESLGQIGRSSKEAGEAIGHKGIGFKSVLEVSSRPELYSGLRDGIHRLSLRFDAAAALESIRQSTPEWDAWVRADGEFADQPSKAVPVLRYPMWVEEPPAIVQELAERGYETVIRLPFDDSREAQSSWELTIRRALNGVTDQILLLLGCFNLVVLDDRLSGRRQEVRLELGPRLGLGEGRSHQEATITRDDVPTSRWLLYRDRDSSRGGLASETAVGVRVDVAEATRPVHAVTGSQDPSPDGSAPFHLFFPTRIGSGLPFLLHGYFEVDAARTGFYLGSAEENDAILDRLADLAVLAVENLASHRTVDLAGLVELIAASPVPEASQARAFRNQVLERLDDVPWIPVASEDDAHAGACPRNLLVATRQSAAALVAAFPTAYIEDATGLFVPDSKLSERAIAFLVDRRQGDLAPFWEAMEQLLRPGETRIWPHGFEDEGFRALLSLPVALGHIDERRTGEILDGLAGDASARLIPIPSGTGGRDLVSIPGRASPTSRRRVGTVMARRSETQAEPLIPPADLDVRFVAEGLLRSEDELDRAKPFGLRPFTVDSVVDRLSVLPATAGDGDRARQWPELVRFLWGLLTRERRSEFGTATWSTQAREFTHGSWFWLHPDRGRHDDAQRVRQRRERYLTRVRLPSRDGTWRPAGSLAFGADWADWVSSNLTSYDQELRARAMRRLEQIAPGPEALLAPPEVLLKYLSDVAIPRQVVLETNPNSPSASDGALPDDGTTIDLSADQIALEQLAFLLRVGCWEVPPIEGFEGREPRAGVTWPWHDLRASFGEGTVKPWDFDAHRWSGRQHGNITVTEDFRFQWALHQDEPDSQVELAAALADGAGLYARLAWATALCPGCSSSGTSHQNTYYTGPAERRPSTLVIQLRHTAWVPTTIGGQPSGVSPPTQVWWHSKPPSGPALLTSPLQHLPLARGIWPEAFRRMCRLESLDEASPQRLLGLHRDLRSQLAAGALDLSGTSRQAFIGLHRQIYEALSQTEGVEVPEVLCELGTQLTYVPPASCRHDDGHHAGYKRRFASYVPFVVIARDKTAVANALGIPTFAVTLSRREGHEGEDVTSLLSTELTDRIPELLAIMVHHSLGGTTLEPTSDAFRQRSRRLNALRIRKLENLVLDAEVVGMPDCRDTIGADSRGETYLDMSTRGVPVLYHDLDTPDWRARLRRLLAAPLAALADAPVYTDAFTLLLTANEPEREDLLRDWGITTADVAQVRGQVGAVTEGELLQHRRWFAALLLACNHPIDLDAVSSDTDDLAALLTEAGISAERSRRIARAGAWPSVRDATSPGSVLPELVDAGISLRQLSDILGQLGEAPLRIRIAQSRFRAWRSSHLQQVVAVLVALGVHEDQAKASADSLREPMSLSFDLDPPLEHLLGPVAALLTDAGATTSGAQLAANPRQTLAELAGLTEVGLDQRSDELYDSEARLRRLAMLAEEWRREIVLLALLATVAGETRSMIRARAEAIEAQIPHVSTPRALVPHISAVFPEQFQSLSNTVAGRISDDLPGRAPERADLHEIAEREGLSTLAADAIIAAREAPRLERVETITRQARELKQSNIKPTAPVGLAMPAPPKPGTGSHVRKWVTAVKVDSNADRRRKQLGDDAESWAVASAVGVMIALDETSRRDAIDQMLGFLEEAFKGPVIDTLRAHGLAAKDPHLDPEDLIDLLQRFMYVAQHSDGFGFDVLSWAPNPDLPGGRPLALEVKSASEGGFFLSSGEWRCAKRLRARKGVPASYAVLVVRRGNNTTLPSSMDLLEDPYRLVKDGFLARTAHTYRVIYATE